MLCETWYLPYSHVHNERTVPLITVILYIFFIAHARNGHISSSGLKLVIAILGPDFLESARNSAIRIHLRHISD